VPVTTKVVISNSTHGEMILDTTLCNVLPVTCSRSVVFSGYFGFLHQ